MSKTHDRRRMVKVAPDLAKELDKWRKSLGPVPSFTAIANEAIFRGLPGDIRYKFMTEPPNPKEPRGR